MNSQGAGATNKVELKPGTHFVRLKFPTGISMDVPRSWQVIGKDLNKVIETSSQATLDLSGIDLPKRDDVNLFAANCVPATMYASVRLNVRRPALAKPDFIRALTKEQLVEMEKEDKAMLEKIAKQAPAFGIKDFLGTTKEEVGGNPAIVTHCRRFDGDTNGPTALVWVIQIYAPERTYRLNLAYRETEEGFWRPVIKRIRDSVKIEP